MLKKAKYIFIISLLIASSFYINIIIKSISPNLPKPGKRPLLYSNQLRQDLKMTFIYSLKKAKESIHLVMFGLTDPHVIKHLYKKSDQNLAVKVFYDKRSSKEIELGPSQAFPIKSKGLMHQKILVVDNSLVFIGSANMTMSSLLMHDNMMIGFFSPEIASFLISRSPYLAGSISSMVGGQKVELFLLPDLQNKALKKVLDLIKNARSSIEIAMFTLTHPKLIDEIIEAKNRGIKVQVAIDSQSSRGASKKAIEKLRKENIHILYSNGLKLCHHKYLYIDDKTLISGSANWTKSAFSKNYDCFLVLYNLDEKQKEFMKKLWKVIELETFYK